jgi:predicted GNAT family N-acyltransferase
VPIFIEIVKTQEDLDAILDLRSSVFIDEQLVPEEEEIDDLDTLESIVDDKVIHLIAKENNKIIATARMFVEGNSIISSSKETHLHVGRVAVRYDARKTGVGRLVMDKCHQVAADRGYSIVTLSAQVQALGFYEKLGYQARGKIYLDAGIEHRDMDIQVSG